MCATSDLRLLPKGRASEHQGPLSPGVPNARPQHHALRESTIVDTDYTVLVTNPCRTVSVRRATENLAPVPARSSQTVAYSRRRAPFSRRQKASERVAFRAVGYLLQLIWFWWLHKTWRRATFRLAFTSNLYFVIALTSDAALVKLCFVK